MEGRARISGRFVADPDVFNVERALTRFRAKCRFEPETGCVIWTGGKTRGRGHHIPYGSFKYGRQRWLAHRWAAHFIKGLTIDGFDVDHCCPIPSKPNTLCVEHVAAETPARNRELQTMRHMIHLQVGVIDYEDVYGPPVEWDPDLMPMFTPPLWLTEGTTHEPADPDDCPF